MDHEIDLIAHLEQKKKEVAAMQQAAEVAREQALALLRLQQRVAEIDELAHGTDSHGASGSHLYSGGTNLSGRSGVASASTDTPGLNIADAAAGGYANHYTYGDRHTDSFPRSRDLAGSSEYQAVSTLSREDRLRFGLDPDFGAAESDVGFDDIHRTLSPLPRREQASEAVPSYSTLSAEDRLRFGLDVDSLRTMQTPEPRATQTGSPVRSFGSPMPALTPGIAAPAVARSIYETEELHRFSAPEDSHTSMGKTLLQLEAVGLDPSALADLQESERMLQRLKMRK